jgi:hypothetical protein
MNPADSHRYPSQVVISGAFSHPPCLATGWHANASTV